MFGVRDNDVAGVCVCVILMLFLCVCVCVSEMVDYIFIRLLMVRLYVYWALFAQCCVFI